jgi:transposase-like protein
MGAATVRTILDHPDRSAADAHLLQVVEALQARFPSALQLLDAEGAILALYDLPPEHRRQIYAPRPVGAKMGAP